MKRPDLSFRTLDHVDLADKRVVIRVDLNLPVRDGEVTDRSRILAVVPTIAEVARKGGKAILLSHFGRPKGKDASQSLSLVRGPLAAALGLPVGFAQDCIGAPAQEAIAAMAPGDVLLLENTRFHPGEEKNDPQLVAALAMLGDIYVNDAFSAAHRAHASTEGLAHRLPAFAGRAMEKELRALARALTSPDRPLAALVGGAKVSTKIDLLEQLTHEVDALVVGGGMANTFLLAKGIAIGKSLAEPDLIDTAQRIMAAAEKNGCQIVLPVDAVVAEKFADNAENRTVSVDYVPAEAMILDIGPRSVDAIKTCFDAARTLVWNGPLGAFELRPFNQGTNAVAHHAAQLTKAGKLLSVAGGGDTLAALNAAGVAEDFSYVSTAGGAFLEWLEGKSLPGVMALQQPGTRSGA